jgi:hypothetical protein
VATKARITADFPTPSEVASHLRIPASRVAELRRQIDLIAIPEAKLRRASGRRKQAAKKK